jgi:hypothetical protein
VATIAAAMKAQRLFRWIIVLLLVALSVYNFLLVSTTGRNGRRHHHPQQQQKQLLQDHHSIPGEILQDPAKLHLKQHLHPFRIHNSNSLKNSINYKDDDIVCLSSSCLLQQGRRLARVFPNRPKETWCIRPSRQQQQQQQQLHRRRMVVRGSNSLPLHDGHWQGLLLVKVPKAASSTSAGVVLRIANQTDTTATVQWQHVEGLHYANRTRARSLLIAPIRQPAARAFSSTWFFLLAPLNITDSDENVLRALNTRRGGGKTKGKGT